MAAPLTALITFGTAGVGAATARVFARDGMRVVVNYYSNVQRADELVAELKSISPLTAVEGRTDFAAIKANLSNRKDIAQLVEETMAVLGGEGKRLDAVFANQGWTHIRDITNLDDNLEEGDWDECFNVNVKSHLWLMQATRPYLEAAEGCFVTMASTAGLTVSGSSMAYSVTKAAQIHLVKALAASCAPKIRVNSVSPSLMLTDWGKQFSEEAISKFTDKTKLKKLAAVEDVGEQVLLFVKSKTVTGTNAVIDGGFTL